MTANTLVKIHKLQQDDAKGIAEYREEGDFIPIFLVRGSDDIDKEGGDNIRGLMYDFVSECRVDAGINDKFVSQGGDHYLIQNIYKDNFEGTNITKGKALKEI